MATRADITPELCRQLLRYEPETGKLFWLERSPSHFPKTGAGGQKGNAARWNAQFAGTEAFTSLCDARTRSHGRIFNIGFFAHRVIWAIVYGDWPSHSIDHVDGNPMNNRLDNLRDVPHQTNMMNKWLASNNSSGVNGVSWDKRSRKWEAYTKIDQRRCSLGRWPTLEEATAARFAADRVLGFSMRHGTLRPAKVIKG